MSGSRVPDGGASGLLSRGGQRVNRLAQNLALVKKRLLPQLQRTAALKAAAAQTLHFLSTTLFPGIRGFSLILSLTDSSTPGELLAQKGEEVSIDDLRVRTPESLAGYALAQSRILCLPNLDSRQVIYMPLSEVARLERGQPPHIAQVDLFALIPTLEETSLEALRSKGLKSAVFVPIDLPSQGKALLVAAAEKADTSAGPQENVMLLAGISTVFTASRV